MGGSELLPGFRSAAGRRRSDPGAAGAGRDGDRAEQGATVLRRRQSHRAAIDAQPGQQGADLPRLRGDQGPSAHDRFQVRLSGSPGGADAAGRSPMAAVGQPKHRNLSAVCDAGRGQGAERWPRKLHRPARRALDPHAPIQAHRAPPDATAQDAPDNPARRGDRRGHRGGGGPDPAAGGRELREPGDRAGVHARQGGGAAQGHGRDAGRADRPVRGRVGGGGPLRRPDWLGHLRAGPAAVQRGHRRHPEARLLRRPLAGGRDGLRCSGDGRRRGRLPGLRPVALPARQRARLRALARRRAGRLAAARGPGDPAIRHRHRLHHRHGRDRQPGGLSASRRSGLPAARPDPGGFLSAPGAHPRTARQPADRMARGARRGRRGAG